MTLRGGGNPDHFCCLGHEQLLEKLRTKQIFVQGVVEQWKICPSDLHSDGMAAAGKRQ